MATMTETKPPPVKYFYKGQTVELVPGGMFDSHWNIYYNEPTKDGGSRRVIKTVSPSEVKTSTEVTKATANTEQGSTTKTTQPVEKLNINEASFADLRRVLPGVGRVTAKKILSNRPETGYTSVDHIKQLNPGLNQLNWGQVETLIKF